MIRLLFFCLLFYIGYKIVVSLVAPRKTPPTSSGHRDPGETAHRDPVCGVYVSEDTAVIGKHDGQRHYFCSMECLEKYRERLS